MTTYRNIGPDPIEVPDAALGQPVEAGATFETDLDVVHPLIEREDGTNTAEAVDQAAQAAADSDDEPRRARRASKRGEQS